MLFGAQINAYADLDSLKQDSNVLVMGLKMEISVINALINQTLS